MEGTIQGMLCSQNGEWRITESLSPLLLGMWFVLMRASSVGGSL